MKRVYTLFILLFCYIFYPHLLLAQIVGTNCFLKGNYVQIGVNSCGAYGSNAAPPAGYAYNVYSGLGFTADSDLDGWATGWPQYCGDYFVPGSPVEGWGIQIGDPIKAYNTDQYCWPTDIPGSISSYSCLAGVYTAIWEGDYISGSYNLHFTQETILKEDETYFVTRTTICNNNPSAVNDFYYMRNVDPDQDQPWSYDFTTYNEVVDQPPLSAQSLVTSEGLTYGCFLGLGSKDPNSRVSYGNFSTNVAGAKAVYNGTSGYYSSGSMTGDIANSIAFYLSEIPGDECRCIAFAYVLDPVDLDEALEATLPVAFGVDGISASSGDTVLVSPGVPVTLDIIGYDGYTYTWSPPTGLSATTGESVTATVSTITTYTITGSGPTCGNLTGTITLIPIVLPVQINYFDAQCSGTDVVLNWETQSELNSKSFIIERSLDGELFEPIAEIPAAVFSNHKIEYSYKDSKASEQLQYYRLSQKDQNDLMHDLAQTIQIVCNRISDDFEIYSATFSDSKIEVHFNALHSGEYAFELLSMNKQMFLQDYLTFSEGSHSLQLSTHQDLPEDIYLLVITDKNTNKQRAIKVIKS